MRATRVHDYKSGSSPSPSCTTQHPQSYAGQHPESTPSESQWRNKIRATKASSACSTLRSSTFLAAISTASSRTSSSASTATSSSGNPSFSRHSWRYLRRQADHASGRQTTVQSSWTTSGVRISRSCYGCFIIRNTRSTMRASRTGQRSSSSQSDGRSPRSRTSPSGSSRRRRSCQISTASCCTTSSTSTRHIWSRGTRRSASGRSSSRWRRACAWGWRSSSPSAAHASARGIPRPAGPAARRPRASATRSSRTSSRTSLISSPHNSLQQQNRRHHNRHPVQSPTILVPEPGTRHLQEMAASQTPTEPAPMAPAQIERRTTQGEEVAREELDEDDGGESGDDSETVKAESDDGEGDHKSSCDEVKVVADKGEESEHKTAEDELSTNSDVQTLVVNPDSELTAGDSSGAHERVGTPGERVGTPVTPPIDVDVSSSESDEDDEFYDSPEDPDSFDAFSVP